MKKIIGALMVLLLLSASATAYVASVSISNDSVDQNESRDKVIEPPNSSEAEEMSDEGKNRNILDNFISKMMSVINS